MKNYNGRFFLYRNNSYYREEGNLPLKTLINPLSNEEFLLKFQLSIAAKNTDSKALLPLSLSDVDMEDYIAENKSHLLLFLGKRQDHFFDNINNNDSFLVKFARTSNPKSNLFL